MTDPKTAQMHCCFSAVLVGVIVVTSTAYEAAGQEGPQRQRPFDRMESAANWQAKDGGVCVLSTDQVAEGKGSLKLTATMSNGSWPCANRRFSLQDWSGYTHLKFKCLAETELAVLPARQMVVVVYGGSKIATADVVGIEKNKWVEVSIPLQPVMKRIPLEAVTRLKFSAGGKEYEDGSVVTFYIDDIVLTVEEAPTEPIALPEDRPPSFAVSDGADMPLVLKVNPMKRVDFDGACIPAIATPMDKLGGRLCRGEFENYAFIINAKLPLTGVTVQWGDLTGPETIPATALDARIAKVWWVAHHLERMGSSRIGRTTPWKLWKPRLIADLLVHDDRLIRVHRDADPAGARDEILNEVRIGRGNEYVVVNKPDVKFPSDVTVRDSKVLEPFDVPEGLKKQIWLTFHVPDAAKTGRYCTTVTVKSGGEVLAEFPFEVEVLPFDLEPPGMVYGLYYRGRFDVVPQQSAPGRIAKTIEQYKRELKDMRDHGFVYPGCQINLQARGPEMLDQVLAIHEELGLPTDRFISMRDKLLNEESAASIGQLVKTWDAVLKRHNPEGVFYADALDERRDSAITAQLPAWDAVHEAGGKMWASISVDQFKYTKGKLDVPVLSGGPIVDGQVTDRGLDAAHRAEISKYRDAGHTEFWSYANPAPAMEDPERFRRNYGIAMWQAGYTGAMIWCYQHMDTDELFHDFTYFNFRDCSFTIPVNDGLLATVQWEGIREAVDDMRYVRTLQKMATEKGKQQEVEAWLGTLTLLTGDLDEIRHKIIEKVLSMSLARTDT